MEATRVLAEHLQWRADAIRVYIKTANAFGKYICVRTKPVHTQSIDFNKHRSTKSANSFGNFGCHKSPPKSGYAKPNKMQICLF